MLQVLFAALVTAASAPPESVHFTEGTFTEVLAKTASAKLPVFVDFYTDWCGWCKRLDANVYTNASVAQMLNTKFVPYKIDAEKGEGPELKARYGVGGYPTMVIIDPQTKKEIDRLVGYAEPEAFLKTVSDIAAGNTFDALQKRTAANPNDLEAWALLADRLGQRDDETALHAALEKVVALDPKDEKGKKSHAELLLAEIGAQSTGDVKPIVDIATRYDGKPVALEAHTFLAMGLGDSKDPLQQKQVKASFEYLLGHGKRDAETLNGFAWFLATQKDSLDKALALATEAGKLEPKSPSILDTVAECLYALGRKDEAIATAKRAVELSTSPEEKEQFQKRLEHFQTGKSKDDESDDDGDGDEADDDGGF